MRYVRTTIKAYLVLIPLYCFVHQFRNGRTLNELTEANVDHLLMTQRATGKLEQLENIELCIHYPLTSHNKSFKQELLLTPFAKEKTEFTEVKEQSKFTQLGNGTLGSGPLI